MKHLGRNLNTQGFADQLKREISQDLQQNDRRQHSPNQMDERLESIVTQIGQHMQEHRKAVNDDVLRLINDHMVDNQEHFAREKADFLSAI